MNIYDTKLIKLSYFNNSKFIELTNEEKERFAFKYHLVHERMPFKRNLSIKINNIINDGLITLIKENREGFINQLYVDFIENLVINMSGFRFRNRELSYHDSFIFKDEEKLFKMLDLFLNYYNNNYPIELDSEVFKNHYDYRYNKDFVEIWDVFHQTYCDNQHEWLYSCIIKKTLIYFISHNELIRDKDLYELIINKLLEDKSLMDYYRMNYKNREGEIPKDLIIRYKQNNKIIT